MDRITARSEGDFYTVLYGSLWAVALSAIWFFCRADPEQPVNYVVEPPEQAKPGWKGEVLDKPSLKVHTNSARVRLLNSLRIGLWRLSNPMLRPRDRAITWAHQSLYRRWYRPRHCEGERRANQMG